MATGGFYTINALGVVVVFRSSGIINFASGGVAMVGGYLEWEFADDLGWPHYLAILTAVAVSAVLGAGLHELVIRPLAAASTLAKVIATLGVLVSLQQVRLRQPQHNPSVDRSQEFRRPERDANTAGRLVAATRDILQRHSRNFR